MPTPKSELFKRPLLITIPSHLRAGVFLGEKTLNASSDYHLDSASFLRRTDEALATCPDAGGLALRLEDDGPLRGKRAIFNVNIFYPCWQWNHADLEGIRSITVRAGKIPYYFQLAHDEPARKFEPARTRTGEMDVRMDGCNGTLIGNTPLPENPDADGFVTLQARIPANVGQHDICLIFTGETRPSMWVLDEVTLNP